MAISTENRQLSLINWLSKTTDETVLSKIEMIKCGTYDWWDEISEEDKVAIEEGASEIERGEFDSYTEFKKQMKNSHGC